MIRRIIMVAAAAAALILVPSAAMAFTAPMDYNAPGYTATVSDSTPAIGQPVKVTICGVPHERITLTITSNQASTNVIEVAGSSARVKAQTKQLNANCAGGWTVRFTAAGVYTLTMTNVAGVVVSTQTVQVLGVSADAAAPTTGALPRTGFDPKGLLVGGGLLLLAGTGALLSARRRRSPQVPA